MSGVGLFIYGAVVTLAVFVAMGLLVWGAILDGRYDREMRERQAREKRDGAVGAPGGRSSPRPSAG